MDRLVLAVALAVLALSAIFILANFRSQENSAAFAVLVDGKAVQAPEQSYPERDSGMSRVYSEAMAKTLLEHNQ